MRFYIFRNTTIEHLFKNKQAVYSGYGDMSLPVGDFDTIVWFYIPPLLANQEELLAEIESYLDRIMWIIKETKAQRYIIFTLTIRFLPTWSETDTRIKKLITVFNQKIEALSFNNPLVKYIDTDDFLKSYAEQEILDWKYFYISDMVISPKIAKAFKTWFDRKLNVLEKKRKKCIVLDLDNTLWGGVLGEDGLEGIHIGNTYPGRAFRQFQENLLEASKNGVILAVCSKNNEQDVLEAWEKHPSMVLKREHFSAYRINWQNKAANISEIAEELNIGLDSIVFIDDNPAERAMVGQNLSEVIVADFPEHPYQLYTFFRQIYDDFFNIYSLTLEDRRKTAQYLENTQRKIHQKDFVNIHDYLSSLEMHLSVRYADELTIARIAQMTQKTNQFNLTTRRFNESDIHDFIVNGHRVVSLAVKDKFGDNGITVAAIVKLKDKTAHIDSFLLSCRILGRGVEKAFIYYLLNTLLSEGFKSVTAEYIPTRKNTQTAFFYESIGFIVTDEKPDGHKMYTLNITEHHDIPKYYHFTVLNTPSVRFTPV